MTPFRLTDTFKTLLQAAIQLCDSVQSEAVLLLVQDTVDWNRLARLAKKSDAGKMIVAAESETILQGAAEAGFAPVLLEMPPGTPVRDRLSQAVLEAVADDVVPPGSRVVALYGGLLPNTIDSISIVHLGEHLDRLSGRNLRQLETRVPLETLKVVVDLAVEVGREGREGKAVGALFVVGDTRRVLAASKSVGFDPVRGYNRKERNLSDPRVREGIKEIAQLDGAILVSMDGTVEATCRYIDSSAASVTLSKGLGARHWAAAAVSRMTKAVAVAVSQSNGTVRLFQNGECILRIEPSHRRPVVWREFEFEPPAKEG